MKLLLILGLALSLQACSQPKPYLNELYCYKDKAYIIKDALGGLVWLEPVPAANIQCKS